MFSAEKATTDALIRIEEEELIFKLEIFLCYYFASNGVLRGKIIPNLQKRDLHKSQNP